MASIKTKMINGFIWRFLQNISAQIVSFAVSIILARLLTPDDYGLVAMITVFTSIAMVFINIGFTSAVIQKKDLSAEDLNTAFYAGLLLAGILYTALFFAAPLISTFYGEPQLVSLLRVESLVVIIGAMYSIPQALITRRMQFKMAFAVSIIGAIVHGVSGILLALGGAGVWALIISTLINNSITGILIWIIVKWKPSCVFSVKSFKNMFAFSAQMLAGSLLDSVFNNIRSLIIGKQYSSEDLAFYNRGYQFPSLIMTQVDGSITTVLFSSLSKFQDNWEDGLHVLRRAMKTSMYICTPLMVGLMVVAEPLIMILLTDKWAGSIEYIRLTAIICLFWPLSAERHALNARGQSKISLKLNIISKVITLVSILSTFWHSVRLMIIGTIIASFVSQIISMIVYSKFLEYSFVDQIKDILPSLILSSVMGVMAFSVSYLPLNYFEMICLQMLVGILVYIIGSLVTRNDNLLYLLKFGKEYLQKHKAC